jgi:hypothetical protein
MALARASSLARAAVVRAAVAPISTVPAIASSLHATPLGRLAASPLVASHNRYMHVTPAPQSATILVAGLTVAGAAVVGQYVLRAWDRRAAAASTGEPPAGDGGEAGRDAAPRGGDAPGAAGASQGADKASAAAGDGGAGGGGDASAGAGASSSGGGMFGAQAFARRFYRGGFEDKMTPREAALILGVR